MNSIVPEISKPAACAHDPIAVRHDTSAKKVGGVVAAMVTPCQEPGIVDPFAAERLARHLIGNGCDGLFVAGSTGELTLLDEDDRRAVIAAACAGADNDGVVYAGISGSGVKQSIRYAQFAAKDGADVAVVMAPFFLKLRQSELLRYLWAVAEASPIPVALYHHPRAATTMDPETVAKAAEHANIVAIKDTSLEIERIRELMAATAGTRIQVLQGNESLVLETLNLGGAGMVSALANIVPEWHAALYCVHRAKSSYEATSWQMQITKLREVFGIEQVGKSIAAFTYTLRLALKQRGWIESLAGMAEGFVASDSFRQEVLDCLVAARVPGTDGNQLRVDAGHMVDRGVNRG